MFDSASAPLRALGRFLHGQDFPRLGMSGPMGFFAILANRLPEAIRERVYALGGQVEAIPPERVKEIDSEEVARWMVSEYPQKRYPAMMIGSSNGAAVHLAAALDIPWLAQTFLALVRHSGIPP